MLDYIMLSIISNTIYLTLAIISGRVHVKTSKLKRNLDFSGYCYLNCFILKESFSIFSTAALFPHVPQ